ncbi:hypothetical protein IWY39_002214 [Sphingobium sp. JAI105]|nr:hypothetical protein [Sphingobium sp. JAI105]
MSLASAFGQDGHDAVETAFDNDIIALLEIDRTGVVSPRKRRTKLTRSTLTTTKSPSAVSKRTYPFIPVPDCSNGDASAAVPSCTATMPPIARDRRTQQFVRPS